MRPALLLLLGLAACDDYLLVVGDGPPDTDVAEGYCAVVELVNAECVVCHGAGGFEPDLSEPAAVLVGQQAKTTGAGLLVDPGNPDGSFFLTKIAGPVPAGQGTLMPPPNGGVDAATVAAIRQWIADGADDVCSDPSDTDGASTDVHPAGFAAVEAHGTDAKLQTLSCTTCHGADLTGTDVAPSCDGCHAEGWRTDCTFCHGDAADGTGAPPVHLSGADDGRDATYVPHRAHTSATALHTAFDCTTCHAKPANVLTPGHVFVGDTTPGIAEVAFAGGLSPAARWNPGTGTCSNLYCHGNGRGSNGTVVHTANVGACADCHPGPASGRDAWVRMSGTHEDHLREGVACWECHRDTADASGITTPAKHVDGVKDVALPVAMTRTGGTCTGTCHAFAHAAGTSWVD